VRDGPSFTPTTPPHSTILRDTPHTHGSEHQMCKKHGTCIAADSVQRVRTYVRVCVCVCVCVYRYFVNPSGICDLCGTVARMVTKGGGMSTEGERLQVSVVLCDTRSETPVPPSQLTHFWQIARHRTLSYPPSTPCFVTTAA
jgi:hypothetical protein